VSDENVERLTRLLLEGFGGGEMSVVDEVVAEDLLEHQQGLPQGREGLKSVIRTLRRAFPDLSYTVVQMAVDEDKVWGHFRSRGTHEGTFTGQPPTGKPIGIDVIDIARFEGGKMVEHWGVPDRLGLLIQLGLFPPRGDTPR
jgi:predicted ester cyclase